MGDTTVRLQERQSKRDSSLSVQDINWLPSLADVEATEIGIVELFSDRNQTMDTVPWSRQSWRFILPRARHFTKIWQMRQPHEQTSNGQRRRSTDHYLVNLKKHFLDAIFSHFDGEIMGHLRDVTDETDVIWRAAVSTVTPLLYRCSLRDRYKESETSWILCQSRKDV